jgi:pectinesterase
MRRFSTLSALMVFWKLALFADPLPRPDIVVAADGSGDFKTIQAAVASISSTNRERTVVFIKDGVYREKIRVDAAFVTLRGQSRKGTRIEFTQLNDDFTRHPDDLGRAVINVNKADDLVLENLTVENTAGKVGPHAFTVYGTGDRTVIVDCDILSHGADTVSLWLGERGRYYHARCNFRGSVDFVCPRGWCYITDCSFYEMKDTAAVWHDGRVEKDMKFVLRNCRFDGVEGWNLARHHRDAQFYFLDCAFSKTMINRAPFRVIYPLNGATPTEADLQRNRELDKDNRWGERSYFFNCHRDGGDYAWHTNNLSTAPGAPGPGQITAAWTFAGKWDPEQRTGPAIRKASSQTNRIELVFSENITVKGRPRLTFRGGGYAEYASGSGSDTLLFIPPPDRRGEAVSLDLQGGCIMASEAGATLRPADLRLPPPGAN